VKFDIFKSPCEMLCIPYKLGWISV